jgi:hypothetical protein
MCFGNVWFDVARSICAPGVAKPLAEFAREMSVVAKPARIRNLTQRLLETQLPNISYSFWTGRANR